MSYLVTGAAGAIGGAVVRRLHEAGEDVIAHDLRPPERIPLGVARVAGDLLDPDADDALLTALPSRLDGVVAAHGIDGAASLPDIDPAFARRVMDVNFATVRRLLQLTLPALEAGRGRFVAVSSQAGLAGEADNAAYSASKFAVVGWLRSLAQTEANGVGYHVLCPGCTESPLLFNAQERFARSRGATTQDEVDDFVRRRAAAVPIGRFATPDETAAAAIYLVAGDGPRPVVLAENGGEVLY